MADFTDDDIVAVEQARTLGVLNNTVTPPVAPVVKNKGGRPKGYSPKTGRIETKGTASEAINTKTVQVPPTPTYEIPMSDAYVWLAFYSALISNVTAPASLGILRASAVAADMALEEYKNRF